MSLTGRKKTERREKKAEECQAISRLTVTVGAACKATNSPLREYCCLAQMSYFRIMEREGGRGMERIREEEKEEEEGPRWWWWRRQRWCVFVRLGANHYRR